MAFTVPLVYFFSEKENVVFVHLTVGSESFSKLGVSIREILSTK